MVRRATKRSEKRKKRTARRIIVVAAEGVNKTELNYFRTFNKRQTKYRVIAAHGNNTDACNIVKDAIKSAEKEELDYDYGDKVFAVIDTDIGKKKQILVARDMANKNKIGLILSNPCFEVWLLQHFRYSTKGYHSSNSAIDDLRRQWPRYEKNINDFSCIFPQTEQAVRNAEKLKTHHASISQNVDVIQCNPSTDVYRVVKMLNGEKSDA